MIRCDDDDDEWDPPLSPEPLKPQIRHETCSKKQNQWNQIWSMMIKDFVQGNGDNLFLEQASSLKGIGSTLWLTVAITASWLRTVVLLYPHIHLKLDFNTNIKVVFIY